MDVKRHALLAMMGLVLAGGVATGASAESPHPRGEPLGDRLARQSVRIREARRGGEICAREAWRIQRVDHRVRRHEARLARRIPG